MRRHMSSLIAAFLMLLVPTVTTAQDKTDDEFMQDFPIKVILCDKDPGKGWDPLGGRGDQPADILEQNNCKPVEKVDITVYNRDIGFFERCTTNDKGECKVEAPASPDRELSVAIHDSTLDRQVYAVEPLKQVMHYTEFKIGRAHV